ncbi:KIZ protein, partial [Alectura lathami]|nr:KIZ protein [Alectura lathami]
RLELERKLMEYKKSDAYLVKLRYTKLKKYLQDVDERQKRALLRNQTFLKEFNQFEARMKTASSEMMEKMEVWYGRELKSGLSLQEGDLSAQGGKEKEYSKQVPWAVRQAGIHPGTAVSRGVHHPALLSMGRCMSTAWSVQQDPPQPTTSFHRQTALCGVETDRHVVRAGGDAWYTNKPDEQDGEADIPTGEEMPLPDSSLHSSLPNSTEHKNPAELCSLSPDRGSVGSGTAALASDRAVEEEVTHEHSVASAEGCKQPVPLAPAPEPSISGEDQESIPGPKQHLSTQRAASSSSHPTEDSSLQPPSSCGAEEEPSGSSVPGSSCSLKEDLEAHEAAVLCQLQVGPQSPCPLPGAGPGQPRDVAVPQASLSDHAAFLEEHRLTEELASVFHSTLLSGEEEPGGQAPLLPREVLAEECGDGSSIQSNESYSSPSILSDSGEVKQAKRAAQLGSAGRQGCDVGGSNSKAKGSQEMCSEGTSSSERSGGLSR